MALLLNVAYEDKDIVKSLGAKWNPILKSWYVESKRDYYKFVKWILNDNEKVNIICDYIYIVIGTKICYKCGSATPVFAFGFDEYFSVYNMDKSNNMVPIEYEYSDNILIANLSDMPEQLKYYFNHHLNYFKDYSKFLRSEYYANHCYNCNALQGNHYLFSEFNAPFYINNQEKAENVQLLKIKLDFDIITNFGYCIDSEGLIETYSDIKDVNITYNY